MLRIFCSECKGNEHFNNYECSNCGLIFGAIWPTVNIRGKEKRWTHCALCGHKFKKNAGKDFTRKYRNK